VNQDDPKYHAWAARRKERLDSLKAELLLKKILEKDRVALANAITLIESNKPEHRKEANKLMFRELGKVPSLKPLEKYS